MEPSNVARPIFALAVLVLVATSAPMGAWSEPLASHRVGLRIALASAPGGFAAMATWNGKDVSAARTSSSAFTWSSDRSVDVGYRWSVPPGSTPVAVATARLQVFFFGFNLVARDVHESNATASTSGSFDLAWAGSGLLGYLIEGDYQVAASLLDPNGSTLWSESFFVRMTAPYDVAAVTPILLIAVILYEIVGLARSGGSPPKAPPSRGRSREGPSTGAAVADATDEGPPPDGGPEP